MQANGQDVERGVIEVAGPDARDLLQRLITNDVETLLPGDARYAALLTPQGKIVVDFLVLSAPTPEQPERFLLDCPVGLAADLAKKLTMYKLRAKVAVTDRSAELGAAPLAEAMTPGGSGLLIFADPRSPVLGFRAIGPHEALAAAHAVPADADARRIAAGVPEGGRDFAYGEAFPHEANLDRIHGVDFGKGCYVGQEVVSRMQHRGTARKRVLAVFFQDEAPVPGSEIVAGTLPVGTMGSSAGGRGLAMVRTDRVAEAQASGHPITANGRSISIVPFVLSTGARAP